MAAAPDTGIFCPMRDTASYRAVSSDPDERDLARARWLGTEGSLDEALEAYRGVLTRRPDDRAAWAEGFELLRRAHRADEALGWARAAREQLPESAFGLALEGAALIDAARYHEALTALESAVDLDPDLAMVWHELGYAAHRLGESSRALAALDRAFALEPHTETLMLRGRILLDAGRYVAAEVAFEGAAQGAPFDAQRNEAEELIRTVRRHALFPGRRPADLPAAHRFFTRTGAVVLASAPGADSDATLVGALVVLTHDSGWRFGQLVVSGDAAPFQPLAHALSLAIQDPAALDPARTPLLVGRAPHPGWTEATARLAAADRGLAFLLEHPADESARADVVGRLAGRGGAVDAANALAESQHPAARISGRRLTG